MFLSKRLCRFFIKNSNSYNFSNQIKNEMHYIDCEGEGSSSVLKIKKSDLPVIAKRPINKIKSKET